MSTVLVYKNHLFGIIITDTRITKHDGSFTDNNEKMFYIPETGFLAGIGLGEFVFDFYAKIMNDNKFPPLPNETNRKFIMSYNKFNSIFETDFKNAKFNEDYYEKITGFLRNTGVFVLGNFGIDVYCWTAGPPVYKKYLNNNIILIHHTNISDSVNVVSDDIFIVLEKMLNKFDEISQSSKDVSKIASVGIVNFDNIYNPIFYKNEISILIDNLTKRTLANQFDEDYFKIV